MIVFGCGSGVSAEEPYYNRLRSDLANSYYWSGNMGMDYVFFCCQWHPILGILFSHP